MENNTSLSEFLTDQEWRNLSSKKSRRSTRSDRELDGQSDRLEFHMIA